MLRVEDTDLDRSTEDSVNAILEAMDWLELDYDEGPFYQTQRFDRYNEAIGQSGKVIHTEPITAVCRLLPFPQLIRPTPGKRFGT